MGSAGVVVTGEGIAEETGGIKVSFRICKPKESCKDSFVKPKESCKRRHKENMIKYKN